MEEAFELIVVCGDTSIISHYIQHSALLPSPVAAFPTHGTLTTALQHMYDRYHSLALVWSTDIVLISGNQHGVRPSICEWKK